MRFCVSVHLSLLFEGVDKGYMHSIRVNSERWELESRDSLGDPLYELWRRESRWGELLSEMWKLTDPPWCLAGRVVCVDWSM